MSIRPLIRFAVVLLSLSVVALPGRAQMPPGFLEQLSPSDREKALSALQAGTVESFDTPTAATTRKLERASATPPESAQRFQETEGELPLFGYALFSGLGNTFAPSADVPIPQNYVLGPGDVVRVQMFGNQNETVNLSVTRDGAVNFPKLGPIQVAGLSIDDARAVIERRVNKELIGVQTNITLGPLRGIQVFLLGDARQPGAYAVSGLATITNALIAGGGVATTGSLRKVELKRAGRTVQRIDLYDFLLRGDSSSDVRLQSGDAVFIPAVGPRVAIAGAVTRPAVYEMSGTLTVRAALQMAGGLVGNARSGQVSLERIGADGQRQLRSLDVRDAAALAIQLRDGDRLDVSALYERAGNPVSVMGHVRYEKSFAWNARLTLAGVLNQAEVRPSEPGRELYAAMGLVERTDAASGLRSWRGFDLAAVMDGSHDEPVQSLDRILILTRADINYLLAGEVRSALAGGLPRATAEYVAAEQSAQSINAEDDPRRAATGQSLRSKSGETEIARGQAEICPGLIEVVKMSDSARAIGIRVLLEGQISAAENRFSQVSAAQSSGASAAGCPQVFKTAPTALPYLLEHSAGLAGEVRQPGLYPFVDGTSLNRLTAVAGGTTSEASDIEIEYFDVNEGAGGTAPRFRRVAKDATLSARPVARAVYKFLPAKALAEVGSVNIRGEVRFPGRYVISRGERYSDLIARAGGLNENAFPFGTVFTRISAQQQETAANRRAAGDLRESLVSSATLGITGQAGGASANAAVLDLIQKLESAPAVGRVVIEGDPAILNVRAGSDFFLEPGDAIYIPKRPNSVSVIGQVLSPGSLAFVSGAKPEDYITQAGGYAQAADDGRSFLVLPNGVARPLQRSFWRYEQESIPPGSVIVVPRDVTPSSALILTERITAILSNLALSAAALVTINR